MVLVVSAALGGCAGPRTVVVEPAVERWPDEANQLDFFDSLAQQTIVTNDDALHALLLFQAGTSPSTCDERLGAAAALGWIEGSPGAQHESAQVGLIASILARTPQLRPGFALDSALDRPWQAEGSDFLGLAATKRLRALGMLPTRSHNQALTGAEFMALLRRVELYEETAPAAADETPP